MDKAPMFPLSGYGSASMVIEKIDPKMQGYSLSAQIKEETPKSRSLTIVVDTPGSSTARKVTFKGLLVTDPDVVAKVEAKTPWGSVAIESELVNRPEVKSLMMNWTSASSYCSRSSYPLKVAWLCAISSSSTRRKI